MTRYLILLLFVTTACSKLFEPTEKTASIALMDFETVYTTAKEVYPYFEYKNIDWEVRCAYYRALLENADGHHLETINQLLLELEDAHVSLIENDEYLETYRTPNQRKADGTFSLDLIEDYTDEPLVFSADRMMAYARIGNMGYIYIKTFNEVQIDAFDAMLGKLSDTDALIIDVRHNGGGNAGRAFHVLKKFIEQDLLTGRQLKAGEIYPGSTIEPDANQHYARPVAILMNGRSMSTTEQFLNATGEVEQITLVGDVSAGASGAPQMYELPSGITLRMSTTCTLRFSDNKPIEWNGIDPDILVEQTVEDIQNGEDKQLRSAIAFLETMRK